MYMFSHNSEQKWEIFFHHRNNHTVVQAYTEILMLGKCHLCLLYYCLSQAAGIMVPICSPIDLLSNLKFVCQPMVVSISGFTLMTMTCYQTKLQSCFSFLTNHSCIPRQMHSNGRTNHLYLLSVQLTVGSIKMGLVVSEQRLVDLWVLLWTRNKAVPLRWYVIVWPLFRSICSWLLLSRPV